MTLILPALIAPLAANALPPSDPVSPQGICQVQAFDLGQVRLLDSPFKAALERDRNYLLDLDPDRLLHTFRLNAGLPSTAEAYGGWESPECELRGHFAGHYLSACALMFAATGDERFGQRVAALVDGLAACQAAQGPSGFLSAFPESFIDRVERRERVWAPYYTLHKVLAGLIDAHARCGNARALDVARRFGDWLAARNERLSEEQMQAMLVVEHGGINEAMANLYALTGDRKHLRAARRFHDRRVLEPLAERRDNLAGLHANTQIPKVTGAARLYEITGETRYRTIAEFFWDAVVRHHSYAIGGNSDREHFGSPDRLARRLSPWTAETCNTHNMLKLTRHVFAWNHAAAYADYYERALYNHILATQDPRTGMMGYHVPLYGAWFMAYNTPHDSFWCCTGTGVESHARYGESIYWHDAASLFVNLFIASRLTWKEKGLVITQETSFPESDTTRLIWQCDNPVSLTLKIRQPAWAGPATVSINGAPIPAAAGPSGYVDLRREWKSGDRVDVRLPMSLRLEPLPDDPARAAICYGPCVLAGALGCGDIVSPMPYAKQEQSEFFEGKTSPPAPVLLTEGRPVREWVEPLPGQPLTFRTKGVGSPADVTLIAFHRLPPQRYSIYWDLLTNAERDRRQAAVAALEQQERELRGQTMDTVRIGDAENEGAHRLESRGSYASAFSGRLGRRSNRGSFSYELAVPSGAPAILHCSYWGGEEDAQFDICVENRKIATQALTGSQPGEFFQVRYPIPSQLIAGKSRVSVMFRAQPHAAAGTLFGLQMLRGMAESRPKGLNLALFATPSTSFVSGHETLEAVNDGFEPLGMDDHSRRCYGNWPKTGTQWIEYQWGQPISASAADIFWWDDGRGVRLPAACRLLWWDGNRFVPVKGVSGLGVVGGSWNTTTFEEITTARLRLEMDGDGKFSTGVIEWKVYDSGKSPKLAPRVTAGSDRTIVLPARTWLEGAIRGSADSLEWRKQAGPGTVTFSDAKALACSAAFSDPGDYVLQLIAVYGEQSASDALKVHVKPAPTLGPPADAAIPPLGSLAVKNAAPCAAEPFDLADVRLLDGPFKQAMETDRAYLLQLEPMRLLAFFQKYAGLLEGDVYLGWEPKGLGGGPSRAILGHYLSACSSMYRATGDPKLQQRINDMVAGLAQCQQVPGNEGLLTSDTEKKGFAQWARGDLHPGGRGLNNLGIVWYHTSKLYNGLFDAYYLCGNAQARDVVVKLADWCGGVVGKFDEAQLQRMLAIEHGDIADALANVYAMTGEPRHLTLARKFRHDAVFAPIAAGIDCLDLLHANTQIPKFRGYQRVHELTGETYWGNAANNFWRFVALDRSYANGGNSYHEHFHPRDKFEEAMHVTPGPETCNTYNMLRLTHHLFSETADAKKIDFYERAIYNQILPSQHPRGGFTYYQALVPGAYRTYSDLEYNFWCCVGTGMQNHGLYGETIYAHQGERLMVNLFIPSELNWREQAIQIVQTTSFPDEPRTKLRVTLPAPKKFTVAVRHPAWVAPGQLKLAVNGQSVPAKGRPGTYVDVSREWKDGDVLSVELPMNLRTELLPNSSSFVAVFYGPILLAARLGREGLAETDLRGTSTMPASHKLPPAKVPAIVVPPADIPAHLDRVEGPHGPQFKSRDLCRPADVLLEPISRIYDERYVIYFRLTSRESWEQDKIRWTQEEQRERALEALTMDEVRVGEQQPEVDHNLKSLRSEASNPAASRQIGRIWRDARNGGWFSYEMRVDPGQPMQLFCTYWGGDRGAHGFDLLVDDKVIATEGAIEKAGEFVQRQYTIPIELTRGKTVIRVKFLAHGGKPTAKVIDCRTLIGEHAK